MIEELTNLEKSRPDVKPENMSRTIVIEAQNMDAGQLLQRIKAIWQVAARICRDAVNEPDCLEGPGIDECRALLPDWLHKNLSDWEILQWAGELTEREWYWWSSSVINNLVKIDLVVEASPVSLWTLEAFVIGNCNGRIVYSNDWISSKELEARL